MWLQLSRKQETSRKLLTQVAKQKQGGRCGGGGFNLFFPLLTWSTGACYISPTIHLLLEF